VVNSNSGFYAISVFTVQWFAVGEPMTSYYFNILPIGDIEKPFIFYLRIVVLLFTIGYVVQELYEFAVEKDKRDYVLDIYN